MYAREFSDLAGADPRVDLALTAVADGLLVACRKAPLATSASATGMQRVLNTRLAD
jgi:hypothetical protein